MGIIGKIVGGTIGFALGGPLGAIAGAVFGHAFDHGNLSLEESSNRHLSGVEQSQLAFFVSTFSMLAKLTKADGTVNEKEINTIRAFADHDLGLSDTSRDIAFNIFHAALASPASFEDFAIQFHNQFQNNFQMLEMMIDILLRVSVADGAVTVPEETLIISAVNIFHFSNDRYVQLKSRYMDSNDQAYQILGCRREDSDDHIKKQYRQLVHTYHPDKIASKGLPEEFTQLAEDKFREIQSAYEAIKKERGFK